VRLTDGSTRARAALAADLVALALFIGAGMRSHGAASPVSVFVRNAVPIASCWLLVAVIARTYRPPSLSRLAVTWALAVPMAVAVRVWWTDSWESGLVFLGVAAAFTMLFLLLGRSAAALIAGSDREPGT